MLEDEHFVPPKIQYKIRNPLVNSYYPTNILLPCDGSIEGTQTFAPSCADV